MSKLHLVLVFLLAAATLVAADISGTWTADVALSAGNGSATFVFKQTGETLAGTYNGVLGDAKVTGSVKGNEATWTFENDQVGKVVFKGTLDGASKISGSAQYGLLGSGTFTAAKK